MVRFTFMRESLRGPTGYRWQPSRTPVTVRIPRKTGFSGDTYDFRQKARRAGCLTLHCMSSPRPRPPALLRGAVTLRWSALLLLAAAAAGLDLRWGTFHQPVTGL